MKSGLSLICIVLDASTSMSARRDEVVESVKEIIQTNKDLPGSAIFSLYSFDSFVNCLIDFKDINGVNEFSYTPSGWTAMYDGIGHAIDDVGYKIAKLAESERPEQVQFIIVTDGEENSSRRYKAIDIKTRIEHQSTKYSWLFTYVGSNQDAITAGSEMGIARGMCATYTDNKLSDTVRMVNTKLAKCRMSEEKSYDSYLNLASFNSLERESLVG